MILNKLLGFFSDDIHLQVYKNSCIFVTDKKEVRIEAIVYLSEDKKIVLGVGNNDSITDTTFKIDLFGDSIYEENIKFECLERFFRYSFELLHSRKSFINPKVYIEDTRALKGLFLGYEEFIIKEALLAAGAREVNFLSSNSKYKLKSCY